MILEFAAQTNLYCFTIRKSHFCETGIDRGSFTKHASCRRFRDGSLGSNHKEAKEKDSTPALSKRSDKVMDKNIMDGS